MSLKPKVKALSRKGRLERQKAGTQVSLDPADPKFEPQREKAREILRPSLLERNKNRAEMTGVQQRLPVHPVQQVLTEDCVRVFSKHLPHTVSSDLLNTPSSLPVHPVQQVPPAHPIPLSPLQWKIWVALKEADQQDELVTYKRLATQCKSTKGGVRDAVYVLQKEGGILEKTIFRQANPQGIRIRCNPKIIVHPVSTKQAQGIKQRGVQQGLPTHSVQQGHTEHHTSMYVSKKNTYIQKKDIPDLLNTCPRSWKIREATLISIADMYPSMNTTVFRLSLRQAIEQEKMGKTKVRHHNAWLRAAFEKNGGPLITEHDIEAQMAGIAQEKPSEQATVDRGEQQPDELAVLRQYLSASEADRATIDAWAREKAKPLLAWVEEGKHPGILEQAKIEAALEYFTSGHTQESIRK